MSEEKVPYLDLRDPVAIQLERIANALEEQIRFNREWLEVNTAWRKENRERMEQEKEESAIQRAENMALERRIVAIHEENAARDQALHEEVRKQAERQARVTDEIVRASYEAYLESLKNPSKELVRAVQTALAEDMRRSTETSAHE